MNNYIATIGIEVHAELNTKSKMFSSSPTNFNDEVNSNINEIDLGLPGSLPSPNKEAVIKGIQLATALDMQIDTLLRFDRKNYFYQDLPKGYQITQQYYPIGKNGQISISNKIIGIERIHLEEDTAKQLLIDGKLCLDYNRCGIPLIEIVSHPEIASAQEAIEYLNELRRILVFLNISDGKMENGSLRADINISVAPIDSKVLGTKVEIKNINSFSNVAKAIEYEFYRQVAQLSKNEPIIQETRRWDDVKKQTIFMRTKSDAIDYRYFPEPNITPIDIAYLVKEAQNKMSKSPKDIKNELKELNISNDLINQILDNYDMYKVFQYVNNQIQSPQLTITWVIIELAALLKQSNKNFTEVDNNFLDRLIDMLNLLKHHEINGKQAKTLLEQIYASSKTVNDLIKELGFVQITDPKIIENYLKGYINKNPNMVSQYKDRPDRVEKFFIGLLMKDTKGQANPIVAIEILKKLII